MPTPAHQPENGGSLLTAVTPLVDLLSKGVAGIAIALYASGFLIISLHHSKYGFTETNPFRPRILAAGAWFFLFSGIPIAIVTAYRGKSQLAWLQFAQFLYPYYVGCVMLSIPASMLFSFSSVPALAAPVRWWWVTAILLSLGALVFLTESKKFPPVVPAVASVLFVSFFVQDAIRELFIAQSFQQRSITLWLFGLGVVTLVELNARSKNFAETAWTKTVFVLLASLLVFASYYYPHIKAAWGGGTPVTVTLFFTKQSPIKASQSVSVQLVDESDAGFYIVGQNETRAISVPRNAVSLVYFSDNPSDSKLLK